MREDDASTLGNPSCQHPSDLSSVFPPCHVALRTASMNCLFSWFLAFRREGQTLERAVRSQSMEYSKLDWTQPQGTSRRGMTVRGPFQPQLSICLQEWELILLCRGFNGSVRCIPWLGGSQALFVKAAVTFSWNGCPSSRPRQMLLANIRYSE